MPAQVVVCDLPRNELRLGERTAELIFDSGLELFDAPAVDQILESRVLTVTAFAVVALDDDDCFRDCRKLFCCDGGEWCAQSWICGVVRMRNTEPAADENRVAAIRTILDRKSTRLNSSHANISYA